MATRATQERTLGAILGMAIGDALGMPAVGLTPEQVASEFGAIRSYHGRSFPDGAELAPGEFTDVTEIALCIMETYTSANGTLDSELIRARMQFLARGESRRWMNAETLRSLDDDTEPWYCSEVSNDPEVALRGATIGLIHAARDLDRSAMYRDTRTVVSLTHCTDAAVEQATLVALAVARVLVGKSTQASLVDDLTASTADQALAAGLARGRDGSTVPSSENEAIDTISSGIAAFVEADRFEDAVFAAASAGGASDSRAALAGALAGAHFGAGGIPQSLIDGLEGRIYLTLAAPWFYRTVQLMNGRGISMDAGNR